VQARLNLSALPKPADAADAAALALCHLAMSPMLGKRRADAARAAASAVVAAHSGGVST